MHPKTLYLDISSERDIENLELHAQFRARKQELDRRYIFERLCSNNPILYSRPNLYVQQKQFRHSGFAKAYDPAHGAIHSDLGRGDAKYPDILRTALVKDRTVLSRMSRNESQSQEHAGQAML
ncbi:hypothetical protein ASPCAL14035 [Aspergillus calidoustus]|uniref:Uncharacterized protein n=1 Tax=Aspergillus calidoustus TaxID=454130 RepID=A0A0U5GLW9_ASPCI|nr:hypothetical protein ASPCAL14035 [Aspergillus calidoustus]